MCKCKQKFDLELKFKSPDEFKYNHCFNCDKELKNKRLKIHGLLKETKFCKEYFHSDNLQNIVKVQFQIDRSREHEFEFCSKNCAKQYISNKSSFVIGKFVNVW